MNKMENNLTLFILDDNIYKSQEYVDKSIYDSSIDSTTLLNLANSYEWKGQHKLQELTLSILESDQSQLGSIITYGFTHPSICLDEIDNGLCPDIIVYDWEYGSETSKQSSLWLTDLLDKSNAFIFVYSQMRDAIPPFLNKQEFDKYAKRFQLFLKGDENNSIFSSEEFILQYILSRISKNVKIRLHGIEVHFTENGYLANPTDILYLENILGKTKLIKNLKNSNSALSPEMIESYIEDISVNIFFYKGKNLLITADSILLTDNNTPDEILSCKKVVKKYGLKKLLDLLENGVIKA